jgi:hypothetical protein
MTADEFGEWLRSSQKFNNAANHAGVVCSGMAKKLNYSTIARPNQTFDEWEDGSTDTLYWKLKKQCRALIQRERPDLSAPAIEELLRKRMARSYRPYRPTF